jgi:hypothetical protein
MPRRGKISTEAVARMRWSTNGTGTPASRVPALLRNNPGNPAEPRMTGPAVGRRYRCRSGDRAKNRCRRRHRDHSRLYRRRSGCRGVRSHKKWRDASRTEESKLGRADYICKSRSVGPPSLHERGSHPGALEGSPGARARRVPHHGSGRPLARPGTKERPTTASDPGMKAFALRAHLHPLETQQAPRVLPARRRRRARPCPGRCALLSN